MKKAHLFLNESAIKLATKQIANAIAELQKVLDAYNRLELPVKVKTVNDLEGLISKGQEWIKDRIALGMEAPKLFGIPLRPRAAVDLLQLPDFTSLELIIHEAKPFLAQIDYMEIIDGKQIVLPESKADEIKSINSVHCNTPRREAMAKTHEALRVALNDFNKAHLAATGLAINVEGELKLWFQKNDERQFVIRDYFYFEISHRLHDTEKALK